MILTKIFLMKNENSSTRLMERKHWRDFQTSPVKYVLQIELTLLHWFENLLFYNLFLNDLKTKTFFDEK